MIVGDLCGDHPGMNLSVCFRIIAACTLPHGGEPALQSGSDLRHGRESSLSESQTLPGSYFCFDVQGTSRAIQLVCIWIAKCSAASLMANYTKDDVGILGYGAVGKTFCSAQSVLTTRTDHPYNSDRQDKSLHAYSQDQQPVTHQARCAEE